MSSATSHLVVISGNDSSLPVVQPPNTTITLVQTPDRATDFQRSSVDRFIEVPEISAESLIELLRPIHRRGTRHRAGVLPGICHPCGGSRRRRAEHSVKSGRCRPHCP